MADEAILGLFVSDTEEEDFMDLVHRRKTMTQRLMADFSAIKGLLFWYSKRLRYDTFPAVLALLGKDAGYFIKLPCYRQALFKTNLI